MQAPVKEEGVVSFLTPIGYQAEDCGYCKDPTTSRRSPNSRAYFFHIPSRHKLAHVRVSFVAAASNAMLPLVLLGISRCCPSPATFLNVPLTLFSSRVFVFSSAIAWIPIAVLDSEQSLPKETRERSGNRSGLTQDFRYLGLSSQQSALRAKQIADSNLYNSLKHSKPCHHYCTWSIPATAKPEVYFNMILILWQPGACCYAISKDLSVDDYQELIDRGWRRSGTLLYKPDLRRHCCPHYTIRIPVDSFKPSRDQRQAVHRWNKFVLGNAYANNAVKVHPKTRAGKAEQKNNFNLISAIHESEYSNVKKPLEPAHRFEVSLEPDAFTEEKYTLFENYQRVVHHEKPSDISKKGFRRFLCDSPLHRTSRPFNGIEQPLGSFHQCYRLDGRLIAVGIVDLLPHCVSGVYFMYHEDFSSWSFGKLSALREATLALEVGYRYYYMGYYIHSCVKMRYKADYRPQYVLDPESLEWDPLDGGLRRLLDTKAYVSLSRERGSSGDKGIPNKEAIGHRHTEKMSSGLPFPLPADASAAVEGGTSLFGLEIPGVLTAEEIVEKVDINRISMELRGGLVVQMEDLVAWEDGDILDPRSLKGFIAEFAACVGPKVAKTMVVRLNR